VLNGTRERSSVASPPSSLVRRPRSRSRSDRSSSHCRRSFSCRSRSSSRSTSSRAPRPPPPRHRHARKKAYPSPRIYGAERRDTLTKEHGLREEIGIRRSSTRVHALPPSVERKDPTTVVTKPVPGRPGCTATSFTLPMSTSSSSHEMSPSVLFRITPPAVGEVEDGGVLRLDRERRPRGVLGRGRYSCPERSLATSRSSSNS
jgi:hypothetical protein